ncbi:MAG: hypothetical protein H6861_09180 [Rhodospirillales bacterium]|nr:hypothetical protein [Rhodospirillales bacterium]
MRFIISVFFVIILSFASTPAQAGDVYACGVPDSVNVPSETEGFCDIHQRRFAYREEYLKMREQMQVRAENFAAPRREALEQYKKDLQVLDEIRTSENTD